MWRKLLFFCLLYFIQGAALAYVVNFQKPYLAAYGISKSALGLFTGLLLVPFIAKVLLGYISDRFPLGRWGSRKPYMIFGLSLFALSYFSLVWIGPAENFWLYATMSWLASLGLAWFDTCADGWAVDMTDEHEHSSLQAAMIAGKSLGLITMSAAFGFLAMHYGFKVIFCILAGLALFILAILLCAHHSPRKIVSSELISGWRDLLKSFYIFFALYAVIYSIASFGVDGLMTLHLYDTENSSNMDIGFFGMWRGLGALAGAILFALVQPYLRLRLSQYLALLGLGLACLLPLLHLHVNFRAVLWGMTWGFQETAFVTLAMRFAQGRFAATLFAGSMIFSNIGTSLGEGLAAPLVEQIGFSGVFSLFAGLAWLSIAFVPAIFKPLRGTSL